MIRHLSDFRCTLAASLMVIAVGLGAVLMSTPAEPVEPRTWARFDDSCRYVPLSIAAEGEPCQ